MTESKATKSTKDKESGQSKHATQKRDAHGTAFHTNETLGNLQDAAGNRAVGQALQGDIPSIVRHVLNSVGRPLDPGIRATMESHFGHSFRNVRIHTDSRSARSASAVRARAYTVGNDIVFGRGNYAPNLTDGRHLLAHELAHVIQQSRGGPAIPPFSRSHPIENSAVKSANAIVHGHGTVHVTGGSMPGLARAEDEGVPIVARFGDDEVKELIRFWRRKIRNEPDLDEKKRYRGYISRLRQRAWILDPRSAKKHRGKQSEGEISHLYSLIGGRSQVSVKHGREVKSGGRTIPDVVISGIAIETKNWLVTNLKTEEQVNTKRSMLSRLRSQIDKRRKHLPATVKQQSIVVDIRGQNATEQQIIEIAKTFARASRLPIQNIQVVVWDENQKRALRESTGAMASSRWTPPVKLSKKKHKLSIASLSSKSTLEQKTKLPTIGKTQTAPIVQPKTPPTIKGQATSETTKPIVKAPIPITETKHLKAKAPSMGKEAATPQSTPVTSAAPTQDIETTPSKTKTPTTIQKSTGTKATQTTARIKVGAPRTTLPKAKAPTTKPRRGRLPTRLAMGGAAGGIALGGANALLNSMLEYKRLRAGGESHEDALRKASLDAAISIGGGKLGTVYNLKKQYEANLKSGQKPGEALASTGGDLLSRAAPSSPLGVAVNTLNTALQVADAPQEVLDVSQTAADVVPANFVGSIGQQGVRAIYNVVQGDKEALDKQLKEIQQGKAGGSFEGYALTGDVVKRLSTGKSLEDAIIGAGSGGTDWQEYQRYRDAGLSDKEAMTKASTPMKRLGSKLGDEAYQFINKDLPEAADYAKKDVRKIVTAAKGVSSAATKQAKETYHQVTTRVNKTVEVAKQKYEQVSSAVHDITQTVESGYGEAVDAAKEKLQNAANTANEAIQTAKAEVSNTVEAAKAKISNFFPW